MTLLAGNQRLNGPCVDPPGSQVEFHTPRWFKCGPLVFALAESLAAPPHMIWSYFIRVDGSAKPHAECKYCGVLIRSAQPGKNMQRHIKSCSDVPAAIKQRIPEAYPDAQQHPVVSTLRQPVLATDGSTTADGNIPVPSLTALQQQQFNVALATMFYLCALPFAIVESQAFREPFQLLAPGIRFPSRHSLSGDLLQRVREQVRERAVALIRGRKFVTIVTDSWTNVNHSTIINFMVVAPGMPSVFWSSLAPGTNSETAEYLAGHLGRVIDEVERDTGSVVAGVLADNASNMDAAWALLEGTRPIFGGGCAAHMLNLLIQDVCQMDFFKTVQGKALNITTYVRDHHAVLSQFLTTLRETSNRHRRALVVPVSTRWYSLHACFLRVHENKSVLKKLFTEPQFAELIKRSASSKPAKKKLGRVKNSIGDASFWRKLEQVIAFLDPVIEALRELESDNCPTSRVYTRFHWLLNHPAYGTDDEPSELQAAIKKLIKARWNHVHTDATGLAFLLDPHTDLDNFVGEDETNTITQGCDFAERSGILQEYNVTRADFNQAMYHFAGVKRRRSPAEIRNIEGADPRDWWQSNAKHHPLVWQIAKRVLAIPSSSAASERAWSITDFIHSKKPNRLTTDKVNTLAYIYVNHHAVLREGDDWARMHSYPESHEALERDGMEQ